MLRVLAAQGLALPGNPRREPVARSPWPDWLELKPNRIWAWDFTHFSRAKRAALAILAVVSRKWVHHLLCAEESSTQVQVVFIQALQAEGLTAAADAAATAELQAALRDPDPQQMAALVTAGQVPLLLAISDNGPQMRSYSTREFLAAVAIAQRFGRPHTPQDQAWIETLFGHVKGEWPHLEHIRDPGQLAVELDRVQVEYNTVRLSAAVGYVTPDDTKAGGRRSARPAGTASRTRGKHASPTVETRRTNNHDHKRGSSPV